MPPEPLEPPDRPVPQVMVPLASPPPRPASVMVLGVLNLVFGVLTALSTVLSIIMLAVAFAAGKVNDPLVQAMADTTWAKVFIVVMNLANLAAGVLMAVSGAKLLNDQRRGVTLGALSAWGSLAVDIIGPLVIYVFIVLPTLGGYAPGSPEYLMRLVTTPCVMAVGAVYPVVLIVMLRRRILRDYFAEIDPA